MTPSPGPFAPTATQWVAGTPTEDAYGNEIPSFTRRSVRVLAQYPGDSVEQDTRAGDEVTADLVLLVPSTVTVSALDEWTVNSVRYKGSGEPGRYRHPFTGTAVTQVNLRRIT